ncbi:histidine kinase dimerization/phospho-acceptor domain-containing protein [Thermodesulfobacteriota bacterium]
MINDNKSPEYEGLHFFGKMNASISHELRNALAVINENAGLIKDLLLMSEKGHPLDLERVSKRVDKVLEQVRRTDSIVDNMNRFAHSIDNEFLKIDAFEYLKFVVKLSERFADMKRVILKLESYEQKVEIATFPFLFENLLYLCIDRAMESPGEDGTISISIEKKGEKVFFRFSGLSTGSKKESTTFPGSDELFKKLNARIIDGDVPGSFMLNIPEHLEL